jgi:hypothetical protein
MVCQQDRNRKQFIISHIGNGRAFLVPLDAKQDERCGPRNPMRYRLKDGRVIASELLHMEARVGDVVSISTMFVSYPVKTRKKAKNGKSK